MISNEMITFSLSDLCEIKYGKDHKKLSDGNVPVYGTGGIMRYVDSYLYDKKSVLIPRKGTLSNIFFVNERFWTVDTLFWTKIKEDIISPKFLYYKLLTLDFSAMNVGSAVPSLTTELLNRIKLEIPTLLEQKAIANILSSLDDKIELNNKINKNLEEIAQTLYKRWFVDFEFPSGIGETYKSNGGEMVDSELGLIPKEWKIESLGDIVKISYGKNLPTKDLIEKGYPVFGGNGIIGYTDSYIYNEPKVLVSCRGAASGAVLNSLSKSFITNNSLILEDNDLLSYEYLKEFSKNREFNDFVSGSAQPQVTIASISKCKMIVPDKAVLENFSKTLKEVNIYLENLFYENDKLSKTRDELLHKLMNGEIEVPIEG